MEEKRRFGDDPREGDAAAVPPVISATERCGCGCGCPCCTAETTEASSAGELG